jgi:ferrous iron transport protein B
MANWKINNMTLLSYFAGVLDIPARLMGMDGVILLAFILGLPANEIVMPIIIMAYLSQASLSEIGDINVLKQLLVANGWTWKTAVSVMLFTLVHWPCATTCLTIRKETGSIKWTALAFLIPAILGSMICILFHAITSFF